jgi:ferredoxin
MIFFSNKDRPFEYGPYPLERLKRDDGISSAERARPKISRPQSEPINGHRPLGEAIAKYHDIFRTLGIVTPFPPKAPIPDDLYRRMVDVKGAAYFLDVAQVGICEISENVWLEEANPLAHSHAVVIVQAYGKYPEKENLAHDWCKGLAAIAANFRVFEVAIAVAEHIQNMGYHAKAHDSDTGDVDFDRLAVLAGVAVRDGENLINPFLDDQFAVAVVTTDYALATDQPLHASAKRAKNIGYWLGLGGGVPGIEWNRRAKRRSDLGIFPMEQVDRVEVPTTQIFDDEVPRVSKRAAFFARTRRGDLGEKSKFEVTRFAFKHPFAQSMVSLIRSMVPHQYGPTADKAPGYDDPAANSKAMKSLSYFLGSEITGICEIPEYAWYSHDDMGKPIEPYHKYAVVMLIDQGYETMEGSSGDDFISGAQSMRAYMRGAEIAGVMAEMLRSLGFTSRSQTNADSDVLHVPVTLLAGLGELSRIGEVILNPFIGPRLKTVVMTTDIPLEPDQPVDFGLQNFCSNCLKCARECPCDAISWGKKTMFNGYEMWKPDVERCTRYRVTNPKGLACGRCMKACPLNKVVTWQGPLMTRIASWFGVNVRWIKPFLVPIAVWLDDALRHGVRNPKKKWWFDLEIVDGACVMPTKGVNQRDLNLDHKIDPDKQKMAYYHANMMPPPDQPDPVMVDRKEAMAAAALLETPEEALARRKNGGGVPAHYLPTPALTTDGQGGRDLDKGVVPWDTHKKSSSAE